MGVFCLLCGEIYRKETVFSKSEYKIADKTYTWTLCPKVKCNGNVIEVDDMFLPIIKMLNKKGYITNHCCCGHVDDGCIESYISFASNVDIPYKPEGYEWETYDNGLCIRKYYPNSDIFELHKQLLENALITLQWANELPEIKMCSQSIYQSLSNESEG